MTRPAHYQCGHCPCTFKKIGALNAHVSKFHTEYVDAKGRRSLQHKYTKTLAKTKDPTPQTSGEFILLDGGQDENVDPETKTSPGHLESVPPPSKPQEKSPEGRSFCSGQKLSFSIPLTAYFPFSVIEPSKKDDDSESKSGFVVLADRDPRTGRVKKHLVAVRIHSDGSRVHLCNFCEKSYKKPSDLCRHLRVHSVEQRYQCRHCPRSYSNKPTMLAHMRIHKSAKAPKTPPSGKCFPCEICDKVFPSNGSLRQVSTAILGMRPDSGAQFKEKASYISSFHIVHLLFFMSYFSYQYLILSYT